MSTLTRLALAAALAGPVSAIATVAYADDIDVDSAEILDVVETTDGSIWKGVIVEFVPGTSIKIELSGGSVHVIPQSDIVRITRQKNPRRVAPAHPARVGLSLPAPVATSGMRLGVGLLVASPTGAWGEQQVNVATSAAPSIQVGFERLYGHVGLSGGGRVTWIYFLNDQPSKDAFWTLETQGYLRAALHVCRFSAYAGLALGLDTNYSYFNSVRHQYLRVGPAFTIEGGADVAVTAHLSLGIAGVIHPGTTAAAAPDAVPSDAAPTISYVGLRVGTTFRF